ncbi:MAG TPA: DUF3093 domain-containing protein [Propionicimonas sp.]|jgi:hypothetical protein|uniref:DUF3093 domain-containing protein n=1 Tax=Propionicimonas sp. TaxID=1955623 RepID=UPI002F3FF0FD
MNYSEQLRVPASWWVVGMFFALTFVTAVGFYAGPMVAVVAGVVTAAGVAAALLWYGSVQVRVDATGLHAGRAVLEWPFAGEVSVLDRAATRSRLGPGADHAAWLLVRGFVAGSIEVAVNDPDDPHPYWLVSTRNPEGLAQAVAECRSISPSRE